MAVLVAVSIRKSYLGYLGKWGKWGNMLKAILTLFIYWAILNYCFDFSAVLDSINNDPDE